MGSESKVGRPTLECWLHGVLFLGLFLYVWQGIRTQWLYYGFGVFAAYPVFSWDSAFLRDVLTTPGGVLSAVAALLAQTYRLGWLGALTVTILLGTLFAGLKCLRGLKASSLRDLAWVPVIAALMIYARYDNPLPILLAITWSVWMAVLYHAIPMKTPWMRGAVFVVLFALAYYLTGATAFIFACVVCLVEACCIEDSLLRLSRRSWLLAARSSSGGSSSDSNLEWSTQSGRCGIPPRGLNSRPSRMC